MVLPDSQQVLDIIKATANEVIMPRYQQLAENDISEKSPGDLVTIADVESERRLEAALEKLVSGSRCVGEEAAEKTPEVIARLNEKGPVWILDPLDGTRNFAHGRAPFAVIVAYCLDGETLMGWIYNPVSGQTVWAIKGQGAWSGNGEKLHIEANVPLAHMKGSLNKVAAKIMRTQNTPPRDISRVGCVGQDYMDLAAGALHFARYAVFLKPWDHAAGVLVYTQAGGYNRLVHSNRPYEANLDPQGLKKNNEVLILAPDASSWEKLAQMTGDL